MTAPIVHRVASWDGLALAADDWRGGTGVAVLCLPGLVRTAGDFAALAARLASAHRVVALDYAGRGRSDPAPDPRRYSAEATLRDVLDICAAIHLHRAVVIGTSFGGLLAMGIGAARPNFLRGVLLNDIGPEIGTEGADFVRRFVADDPALPSLDAAIAYLRAVLPPLGLAGEAAWRAMAELTYAPDAAGRWRPLWDTRIAAMLRAPPADLWPLFAALAHVPVTLIRGGASNLLLAATVARMRTCRPDMPIIELPGIGHAPTLTETASLAAIDALLARAA